MASAAVNQSGIEITVHWLQSSRAQRVLVLLEELNLKYKIKTYKRDKNALAPGELKRIHALGKSPSVEINIPGQAPIVLAESGAIMEYLCEHFGKHLIPDRSIPGTQSHFGVDSQEFTRNRYFMHYAEGSLMGLLGITAVIRNIKKAPVPFFIKPITTMIAGRIDDEFLNPSFKTHFEFLEDQLRTSPNGGSFLCGKEVTGGDFMMIFPLELCKSWVGLESSKYPKLCAYLDMMEQRESYKAAAKKVVEIEGSFEPVF